MQLSIDRRDSPRLYSLALFSDPEAEVEFSTWRRRGTTVSHYNNYSISVAPILHKHDNSLAFFHKEIGAKKCLPYSMWNCKDNKRDHTDSFTRDKVPSNHSFIYPFVNQSYKVPCMVHLVPCEQYTVSWIATEDFTVLCKVPGVLLTGAPSAI